MFQEINTNGGYRMHVLNVEIYGTFGDLENCTHYMIFPNFNMYLFLSIFLKGS